MKTDRVPRRDHVSRVQRLARQRAEAQARRVPWQRLLETRNDYIGWQEFYLWVRSVLEVEQCIPDWLMEILNQRCPGFVENERELTPKIAKNRPLPLRLEDWIDDHIFGSAKKEGWFNSVTYYAIREPRYQRAEVCWSECVKKWKKARPLRYPTFEEWRLMAEGCDPTAHLVPDLRKRMAGIRRVDAVRFAEAMSRYIDLEALAYWARPALEQGSELPKTVLTELQDRCPGFLKPGPHSRNWESFIRCQNRYSKSRGGGVLITSFKGRPPSKPTAVNSVTQYIVQAESMRGIEICAWLCCPSVELLREAACRALQQADRWRLAGTDAVESGGPSSEILNGVVGDHSNSGPKEF